LSIANYFTFLRIIMSPLFLLVYAEHEFLGLSFTQLPYVLLALLAISEFSDALDGYLARKYNEVTEFGKVLDPMADSIARISAFLTFTLDPVRLPLPLILIFFYRDSMISTLRTLCALKGFALAARKSGKIKALVQASTAFCILGLMILYAQGFLSLENMQSSAFYLASFAGLYTIYSGFDYIYAHWPYVYKLLWPCEAVKK
jgi:CDP-diacylglycerol---glycerol-3-phosphate 3-phosphatidyltransferase